VSPCASAPTMKISMSDNFKHIPVLLQESIAYLNIKDNGIYVDCTLGGGSHTEKIKSQKPKVKIICFDLDQEAIRAAKEKLGEGTTYINDNFANIKKHITEPIDGFLFDLGVSSHQIDTATRGFSIREDGPLDMRMSHSQKLTAKEIINSYSHEALTELFFQFGQERFSRRIAKRITIEREREEIATTSRLKEIIENAIPTWKKRETTTRIFQALRIAVNNELESLQTALLDAIELLKPGGRIVVISYHSLEDRIVKHTFKQSGLKILTKKPVQASEAESSSNPRAKSGKLRAGEKEPRRLVAGS